MTTFRHEQRRSKSQSHLSTLISSGPPRSHCYLTTDAKRSLRGRTTISQLVILSEARRAKRAERSRRTPTSLTSRAAGMSLNSTLGAARCYFGNTRAAPTITPR